MSKLQGVNVSVLFHEFTLVALRTKCPDLMDEGEKSDTMQTISGSLHLEIVSAVFQRDLVAKAWLFGQGRYFLQWSVSCNTAGYRCLSVKNTNKMYFAFL